MQKKKQFDISCGRFGDFRRSPNEWIVYHPDYFDYQKQGNMKRYVARCLYLRGRIRAITENEVESAFSLSNSGKPTVMSFMSHDTRDIEPDMDVVNEWIKNAAVKYPEVKFKFSNAVDAIRSALNLKKETPAKFEINWNNPIFEIHADKELFGPQPFFCFKTWDFNCYHDNLDKHDDTTWSYTFDYNTIDPRALMCVGFGTNDNFGNTTTCLFDMSTSEIKTKYRNTLKNNI